MPMCSLKYMTQAICCRILLLELLDAGHIAMDAVSFVFLLYNFAV